MHSLKIFIYQMWFMVLKFFYLFYTYSPQFFNVIYILHRLVRSCVRYYFCYVKKHWGLLLYFLPRFFALADRASAARSNSFALTLV